jgi:hypothetical protein
MTRYLIITTLSLFLIACSHTEKKESEKKSNKKDQYSENTILKKWEGKHTKILVKKYGKPDLIMNTTLRGEPASEGYVYEQQRLAGNPTCINVYVATMSDGKIQKYFCR